VSLASLWFKCIIFENLTMPTLLILQEESAITPEQLETIRNLASGYDLWMTTKPLEDPDRLSEVEISAGFKPPHELILNGKLKWHHAFSAGMDWMFEIDGYQNLPMILTNSSGIHAIPMSEHTFAMILAFNRSLPRSIRHQINNHWNSFPPGSRLETLSGKTMLILGLGAIGERVAKLAKAHDMRVIGIRRQPEKTSAWVDTMAGPDQLDDKLPEADYVVCLLPKTPDSHHILSTQQFKLMKQSAFIVNLGRGMHIDEVAMTDALRTGSIRGAGLDTFEKEPLPESSPLWEMDNVIITPHVSGFQPDYGYEARKLFIENLGHFLSAKPLVNEVNKALGYSTNKSGKS
jgi:phosphoglycerate dehydrogenase-like enzyme